MRLSDSKVIKLMFVVFFMLSLASMQSVFADEYGKAEMVHSKAMDKDLPILVFTPDFYESTEKEYPVVYLLHGWNTEPVNVKGLRTLYPPELKVLELANYYQVIIVTPTIGRTFYLDSPKIPENKYATYVGQELPAWVDEHYRTQANREGRILAGFSMGGYGAVSLQCRYPDTFCLALSRAGAMNLAYSIEDNSSDDVTDDQRKVIGDYWTERKNYHQNKCVTLVNHIRDRDDVAFVIAVGTKDFLLKSNREFRQKLVEIGMPHIYAEYPGGHLWGPDCLGSLLAQMQFFRDTVY